MQYFRIVDYEKFKMHQKIDPPWIKFPRFLTVHAGYTRLHDSYKLHFIHMLMVASSNGNQFPYDKVLIGRQLMVNSPVKLDKLENAGLIEIFNPVPETENAPKHSKAKHSKAEHKDTPKDPKTQESSGPLPSDKKGPAKPSNPKTKPNPDIKILIDHYFQEYFRIFEIKPVIAGGKVGKIFKDLLAKWPVETLREIVTLYLEDHDQFLLNSGHSIELFKSRFNAYAVKLEGKAGTAPVPKTSFQKNRDVVDDWAKSYPNDQTGGIFDGKQRSIQSRN